MLGEILVLGREGVDRRCHDQRPGGIEAFPNVRGTGEHVAVRLLHERAQEVPHLMGLAVRGVGADMAAPDHAESGGAHRGHKPRGLRVMEDHHIARPDQRPQLERVGLQGGAVRLPSPPAEADAVARIAVEHVVDALGDREELVGPRRRGDHGPANVGARAASVRHQRAEHLRHAAAGGGRVHVPDGAPAQARGAPAQRRRSREPQTSAPSTSLNCEGSRGAIGIVCTCFIATPARWPLLI